MAHTIILGAGISGLTAAWHLHQSHPHEKITLLEASSRTGGWMQTMQHEGFLFDLGPRGFRPSGKGKHTLALVEALGLQEQIIPAELSSKQRYLWQNNQLHPLPNGIWGALLSPLTRQALPLLLKEGWKPVGERDDESIASFIERRFSSEILHNFIDPLVSGIYAGDPAQLSMRSCFPQLFQWEKKYGSVIKGALFHKSNGKKWSPFVSKMSQYPLVTFKRGMEALPQALTRHLHSLIEYDARIIEINSLSGKIWMKLQNGNEMIGDRVISTLSARKLGDLLPQLKEDCHKIPSASVAVVCLGYRQKVLKNQGFGYLIPHAEGESILGCVWDSAVFPQQNKSPEETRLTVMIGGARFPHFENLNENTLTKLALEALARHLKIEVLPDAIFIKSCQNAIPQYPVGHHLIVEKIREGLRRIHPEFKAIGTSFNGVAVNDCVLCEFC